MKFLVLTSQHNQTKIAINFKYIISFNSNKEGGTTIAEQGSPYGQMESVCWKVTESFEEICKLLKE